MSIDTLEYKIESQTIRESRIARNYTFLGEYIKSDSLAPFVFPDRFDRLSKTDLAYLDQFNQVSPFAIIDSLSKIHSVILINENHAVPRHRIFFHNLLDDLAKNGYSLIGMEALTTNYKHISGRDSVPYNLNDTILNVRGYPLYSGFTGTYIKEPQMANSIRRGAALGYSFFGYEKLKGDREWNQAQNIAKMRRQYPDQKIVVLCGFMHVAEDRVEDIDVKLMGHYLKEALGEDILTIEQTRLSYNPIQNSELFDHVNPTEICVLQNRRTKKIFNVLPGMNPSYDISIFHPSHNIYKGRPAWLMDRENTKEWNYTIDDDLIYPVTITATPKGQLWSTPMDIVVAHNNQNWPPLFLNGGEYVLCFSDNYGNRKEEAVVVE
ncbi:MAG: hypothetical protein P1U56_06280 [Saprospiraceae bacterium]|nr:hypothetical protein [Saprospiraceae bacterium]